MSDPTFSDIDFENKMTWVWTTLKSIDIEHWSVRSDKKGFLAMSHR